MRIAQIAPLTEAIPPKLYGGTERVVSWLTEELVEPRPRCHAVRERRFADGGPSRADVAAGACVWMSRCAIPWRCTSRCSSMCAGMPTSSTSCISISTTFRSRVLAPVHALHHHDARSPRPAGASDGVRRLRIGAGDLDLRRPAQPVPQARWLRTVYHGLPAGLLRPQPAKPGYLAFLGRIAPEKAVDRAIRIAVRCRLPLKIAAKVDRVDRDYFERDIRPLLGLPGIEFVGEIGDGDKSAFLGGALRAAHAHRLARAVRPGDDRGHGLRHAGDRLPQRLGARGRSSTALTGLIVDERGRPPRTPSPTSSRACRGQTIRARFEERFTARRMAKRLCRDLSRA